MNVSRTSRIEDKLRSKTPQLITPRKQGSGQTPRRKTNATALGLTADPPASDIIRPNTAEGTYSVAPLRARIEIAQALHTRTPEARLRRLQAALNHNRYWGGILDSRPMSRTDAMDLRSARGEARTLARQLGEDKVRDRKQEDEANEEVQIIMAGCRVSAEEVHHVEEEVPQEETPPPKTPTPPPRTPTPPPPTTEEIARQLWVEAFSNKVEIDVLMNDTTPQKLANPTVKAQETAEQQENDDIQKDGEVAEVNAKETTRLSGSKEGTSAGWDPMNATFQLSAISQQLSEIYLQPLNAGARLKTAAPFSEAWHKSQEGVYVSNMSGPWVEVDYRDDGGMILPADVYEFLGPPDVMDGCQLRYYAAQPRDDVNPEGSFDEPLSAPLVFTKVKEEDGSIDIVAECEFPGGRKVDITFANEAECEGCSLSIEPALSAGAAGAGAYPSFLKLEVVLEAALGQDYPSDVQISWPQWWLGLKTLMPPAVLESAGMIWGGARLNMGPN